MWKRFLRDYLSYSYKERIGIMTLTGLIVVCVFIPFLYPYLISQKQYDHAKFDSEIARLQLRYPDSSSNRKYSVKDDEDNFNDYPPTGNKNPYERTTAEVFNFDPNSATAADWKRLGIKDKTVQTIQKYLSKGGHFYKPQDITKIWGLHPEDIKRLLPYITIQQKETAYINHDEPVSAYPRQTSYKPNNIVSLDINTADTTALIALPGIGSKLAQRIINFRNKLGGYYTIEQVGETFGLPDSTFQKIKSYLKISGTPVKKIDINTALLDDMKSHPYIRYAIANAIIQYRTQHGNFSSVADLKKIMMVTEDIFRKIEPYIVIQ